MYLKLNEEYQYSTYRWYGKKLFLLGSGRKKERKIVHVRGKQSPWIWKIILTPHETHTFVAWQIMHGSLDHLPCNIIHMYICSYFRSIACHKHSLGSVREYTVPLISHSYFAVACMYNVHTYIQVCTKSKASTWRLTRRFNCIGKDTGINAQTEQ